mmetsp:Transcript_39287/g.125292  ORF Transcript_39287/g.125292 Transcript_39287/m.125292 type:complete len:485 (-) Transcript_39287:30-1484(-)
MRPEHGVVCVHGRLDALLAHLLEHVERGLPFAAPLACADERVERDGVGLHPRRAHGTEHLARLGRVPAARITRTNEGTVGVHVGLNPLRLHLREHALGLRPPPALLARADEGAVRVHVRAKPARAHLVQDRQRLLPLPRLLVHRDERVEGDHLGLEPRLPHLREERGRPAPVAALAAGGDEVVEHHRVRLHSRPLHLVVYPESGLPLPRLHAPVHQRPVRDGIRLHPARALHLLEEVHCKVQLPACGACRDRRVVCHHIHGDAARLHLLEHVQSGLPLPPRLTCAHDGAAGVHVGAHALSIHLVEHAQRALPLPSPREGRDQGRVCEHVRNQARAAHLVGKLEGLVPPVLPRLARRGDHAVVCEVIGAALPLLHSAEHLLGLVPPPPPRASDDCGVVDRGGRLNPELVHRLPHRDGLLGPRRARLAQEGDDADNVHVVEGLPCLLRRLERIEGGGLTGDERLGGYLQAGGSFDRGPREGQRIAL